MKSKKILSLSAISLLSLYAVFVVWYEHHEHREAQSRLEIHARIIGDALWNYYPKGAAEYLTLASQLQNYQHLVVTDTRGKIFQRVEGNEPDWSEKLLKSLGLIPTVHLKANVLHQDQIIGTIEAVWDCDTIYMEILVFLALLMTYVIFQLNIRLLHAKYFLEERVSQRTRELSQLNESLRLEVKEHHRARGALAESERNYREIFNATSDGIFIHDAATGEIIDINLPALKMYGYDEGRADKLTIGQFSSHKKKYDQKAAEEKILKARKEGPQIFEWQAKKKNGELFWVEVNLRFSTIGDEEMVLAVVRDISQRKKTQEMMIQSEKMLSVGGLAAGMAHEINNPLAGMMQSANVIANRLGRDMNIPANHEAARKAGTTMEAIQAFMEDRGILKMVESIRLSGVRAAKIVANMLSFARKSDAGVSSHILSSLMDKTLELAATDYDLKKKYDFKVIEIRKEYEDKLPIVPCEGAKIQQVLLNILINGAQAMQRAGIEKPVFTLRTKMENAGKTACIEIEDNGPGMDEATRKRVFEPFFTTKPVGEGTGLGLSVSYFIISENHGGEMTVTSSPGQGAKFTIRLPCNRT